MILNKQITLRQITKGEDRPSNHGQVSDSINDTLVTVNVTTLSVQKTIRDFGITSPVMVNVRSLTPLPDFTIALIQLDGVLVTFKPYAKQSISDRRNLTLIEGDA